MTPLAEELDGSDAEKMAPMFLSPLNRNSQALRSSERERIRMLSLQSVFKRSIALEKTEQTLLWPL